MHSDLLDSFSLGKAMDLKVSLRTPEDQEDPHIYSSTNSSTQHSDYIAAVCMTSNRLKIIPQCALTQAQRNLLH
jgi:hypothetical protein